MSQLFQEIQQAFEQHKDSELSIFPEHGCTYLMTGSNSNQVNLSVAAFQEALQIINENRGAYLVIKPDENGNFKISNYLAEPIGHLTADGFRALAAKAA